MHCLLAAGMATPTASKRKRVVLSLEKKLAILDRLSKGETQAKIAHEYGIGRATVYDLKKNGNKIKSYASTMESLSFSKKKRKIMRMAADDKLDDAPYLWFVQKRSQGMPISGPVLCEKAIQLHSKIHGDFAPEFKASKEWLWRFCNRHGMRQLSIQGEKLSSDMTAPDSFKEELQTLMESEGLTLENLYNCDETGLCYRMLPTKTIADRKRKHLA